MVSVFLLSQGISSATMLRNDRTQRIRPPLVRAPSGFWRFAARNLMTRPLRTGLALFGLSIPVLGVIGLYSLSVGLRYLVADAVGQIQGILVLRQGAPTDLFSDLPSSMAERLRAVPGVRVVAPQLWKLAPSIEGRNLFHRSFLKARDGQRNQPLRGLLELVQIEGQDITAHAKLRGDVYRNRLMPPDQGGGRFLDETDLGRPHIVLSTTLAREFPDASGAPRRVGGTLQIGRQDFTIVGMYQTGSMLLDHTIVMDLTTARTLLDLREDSVSCFLVEPHRQTDTDLIARRIRMTISGVDARTMSQFYHGASRMLRSLDKLLLLLVSLALLVGSVGVLNTMLMSTSERLLEFGIMRSTGWSGGDVLYLVLAESLVLGLCAGLLGCALAVAAVSLVNPLLDGGMKLVITPAILLLGIALALGLGTLGGLYPAWRASRLAPMEVIRRGTR